MLVELLRPATPELARRWLAALLMVPENERAGVVAAVERQITGTYELAGHPELDIVHPAVAREGYVEQVVVTYAPAPKPGVGDATEKRAKRPVQDRAQSRTQSRAR